jgi:hypothetical protein
MTTMLLVTLLIPVLWAEPHAPADLSGPWTFEWKPDFSGHETAHECRIEQAGLKLTISCEGATMKGEVKGRKATFQHQTGRNDEGTAVYKVELDAKGTTMTGTWHLSRENREGRFAARKHSAG